MRLLMAAAECSPLASTGGMGEAVAGLAKAAADHGIEVTVAIPRYRHLHDTGVVAADTPVPAYRHQLGEVEVLLIDDAEAFDRPGIYGPKPGDAYEDEWFRWARFSAAVAQLATGFDLVHLHDGHVGPVALLTGVPTVQTIHNASYPLLGPLADAADELGVPWQDRMLGGALEWYGQANYLKAGIVGATRVTTVSPTFATQITNDASVTGGLSEVINWLDPPVVGIVNGIDTESWDPQRDPVLAAPFSAKRLKARDESRTALLQKADLDDGFLVGNVGRMTEQKGLHLIDAGLDRLTEDGLRLLLIGNGNLDVMVDGWQTRHPRSVRHLDYSEQLARMLFAGADAYFMPSQFEPCGIGQLYAMRYGCPPLVHFTGGLTDTVLDLDEQPDGATGFGFRSFLPEEAAKTIRRAMRVHRIAKKEWKELQRNGMSRDFSWEHAALDYLRIYESAIGASEQRSEAKT
ncbi:MAG: glycogen/starch synthase [Acidimicrobiia bacterium]|nr:glycogen/starch synthase [Acidimicrobiia bacterium]MDH3397116.1 glycogen/starch synthase [Acidimicrobiia bacterium]